MKKGIIQYVLIAIGLIFSGLFLYHIIMPERKVIDTRVSSYDQKKDEPDSITDAIQGHMYSIAKTLDNEETKNRNTYDNWGYLITAITAIGLGAIRLSQGKAYSQLHEAIKSIETKNSEDHNRIFKHLVKVEDIKDKDDIIDRLVEIEMDRLMQLHFIDDTANINKMQLLIMGIAERTRAFFNDNLTHNFSHEDYMEACLRIDARNNEGCSQVKELGFDEGFYKNFLVLQKSVTDSMRSELHRLMMDNITNNKYARFGDIMRKFLRDYLSSIVILFAKSTTK